jgi:hypothetical protein
MENTLVIGDHSKNRPHNRLMSDRIEGHRLLNSNREYLLYLVHRTNLLYHQYGSVKKGRLGRRQPFPLPTLKTDEFTKTSKGKYL